MKEIIILGTGCAGCKALFTTVEKVVRESGLDANISKQENIMEIMRYNVLSLPALVVDGQVAATGRLSETEVKKVLGV
ncbi:MAG: thioredoxin family protein [Paludibacteraceae bacterium]